MIWRVKLLHLGSSRFFFFGGYKGQEVAEELLEDFEKKKKYKAEAKMATAKF